MITESFVEEVASRRLITDDHDNEAVEVELSNFPSEKKMIPFTRFLCCDWTFYLDIAESGTQKLKDK